MTPETGKKPPISRRTFLRLAALTGIGAGLAFLDHLTQLVGMVTYVRWMLRGYWKRSVATPAVVALGECPTYDASVLERLRDLWRQAEMPDVQGKRVLVKPNLID
jgi:hypothetical protein